MIVDTHFITRDRMGRLVAFVARLWQDSAWKEPLFGVGIDEETAIAIDSNGKGKMLMQGRDGGRAFILSPSHGPEECRRNQPLEFDKIPVQKLDAYYRDTYDFVTMSGGEASQRYTISARDGRLNTNDPYSPPEDDRRDLR